MLVFLNKIKKNFPTNKKTWIAFTLTALPVILSSFIFALNSFIDNFMSINMAGGNQALSYANAWTEIEIGIISATTIIGTALFSQYYGNKNWWKVTEVLNLRMIFSFFICMIFVIPFVFATNFMIDVISGFDNISENIRSQACDYLQLITVSWILNSWAFTMAMILREKNHGAITIISSVLTVMVNVILNSIFIYVLNYGIIYLAYSTIVSQTIAIAFMMIWTWFNDRRIFINIFKIFNVSPHILKQFFKRIWSFLLFAIGSIFVNIRFIFWNVGYGTGSIGDPVLRLSSATVLGITGMFFNIFWTTFEAMSATVAVYIGKELGQGNIDIAKKRAKELQGFHFVVGLVIGLIALCFSFVTEKMNFLAEGYEKELKNYYLDQANPIPNGYTLDQILNQARIEFLSNIKLSLLGITVFIPLFVWFVSRRIIIAVGGLTNIVATTEAIVGGLQIVWLVIICYTFSNLVTFPWAYFIFFLSDVPKFFVYEILYHKVNWARTLTHSQTID